MIRFAHPELLYIFFPLAIICLVIRLKWYRAPVYRYPLASYLGAHGQATHHPYRVIALLVRAMALGVLALAIGQPQWVDPQSGVQVEGIDIILALDVSGSMQFQDFKDDPRSRIQVAKDEAIRFIDKRPHDAMGVVIFGKDVLSRAPLTLDKTLLRGIVEELEIGIINAEGTMLSCALLTAANRLKDSKASSKVIILLTDGEPSEGDCAPAIPLEVAKKLGIKIYTVGIGSDEDGFFLTSMGIQPKPKINTTLLTSLAEQTGGTFFQARSPADMRAIYDRIDTLEKTIHDAPQYAHYTELFVPIVWALLLLLIAHLALITFRWFGVYQ